MQIFSPRVVSLTGKIDRFSDTVGLAVAWLNVPLVLAVAYEVIARYFFNAPTIWAYDVTYMLYAAIFMLGAAYALHKGAHIRTDFFFESWSTRTKGLIDSIAYIGLFFPSLIVFLFVSADDAWYAFVLGETSEQTPWRPLSVALQNDHSTHLPAADHPRRLRGDQKPARRADRHRARAQREGRGLGQ